MVRIEWSILARADLREIYDYIARDSGRYARATVEKIVGAAERLMQWPKIGEPLSEFSGDRQIIVGNYRLIYREDEPSQRILIIGVIHASRNLPPLIEARGGDQG